MTLKLRTFDTQAFTCQSDLGTRDDHVAFQIISYPGVASRKPFSAKVGLSGGVDDCILFRASSADSNGVSSGS